MTHLAETKQDFACQVYTRFAEQASTLRHSFISSLNYYIDWNLTEKLVLLTFQANIKCTTYDWEPTICRPSMTEFQLLPSNLTYLPFAIQSTVPYSICLRPCNWLPGVPGAADSFVFPCLSTWHCLRHTSHEIKGYAGYKRRSIYSKIFNLEQGNTWKPLKLCCPVSCVQRPLDCIFFNSNQGCVRLHVDKFQEFKPWPLPLYLFFLLPFGAMILREISLIN